MQRVPRGAAATTMARHTRRPGPAAAAAAVVTVAATLLLALAEVRPTAAQPGAPLPKPSADAAAADAKANGVADADASAGPSPPPSSSSSSSQAKKADAPLEPQGGSCAGACGSCWFDRNDASVVGLLSHDSPAVRPSTTLAMANAWQPGASSYACKCFYLALLRFLPLTGGRESLVPTHTRGSVCVSLATRIPLRHPRPNVTPVSSAKFTPRDVATA